MDKIETHGILPTKYFLDKNFMPLRDYLVQSLENSQAYKHYIHDQIYDIVTDALLILKPTYEQAKDTQCSICGDEIYGRVQVHHHNEKCKKCGYEMIATQLHDCKK